MLFAPFIESFECLGCLERGSVWVQEIMEVHEFGQWAPQRKKTVQQEAVDRFLPHAEIIKLSAGKLFQIRAVILQGCLTDYFFRARITYEQHIGLNQLQYCDPIPLPGLFNEPKGRVPAAGVSVFPRKPAGL